MRAFSASGIILTANGDSCGIPEDRKRAELPYVARPPASVFNEFVHNASGGTRQQHLHLVEKRICRTDAIEQCRRCSTKHGIRFNDRNSGCQLKDAVFDAEVIPIRGISVDMVVESNNHLFLHERVGTAFIPFLVATNRCPP